MIETPGSDEQWVDVPAPEPAAVDSTGDDWLDSVLARLTAVVDELLDADLDCLIRLDGPSTGLHAAARVLERERRRLAMFDAKYVAAVEAGDEPARYAKTSTPVFLRDQLRVSIGEARRRVALAHACSPVCGFSGGESLPARLSTLAAAVTAGQVSAEHAAVVLAVMDAVPGSVTGADRDAVEAGAVEVALVADPGRLARWGEQALDRVDPDGRLRDYHYAHAHRGITVTPHRGRAGGRITGLLSVELLETFQTIFDTLASPDPATPDPATADAAVSREAVRDTRPPDARRHDAVLEAFGIALNGDRLPASGGTPATVVFHVRVPDSVPRTLNRLRPNRLDPLNGLDRLDPNAMAVTEHGHQIPVSDALQIADQAMVYTLVTNTRDVPLALGRASRLATPGQTVALAARDRGCTFPGCDRPPAHCQRHHITDWAAGGETRLDNLTLLCGHHHREHAKRGWTITMISGHPWWIPPAWIDPTRQPVRNQAHDYPDTG